MLFRRLALKSWIERRVISPSITPFSSTSSSPSSSPSPSPSSSSSSDYDVLISGGGVVGASLCASLLRSPETKGLKIGLIELRKPKLLEDIEKDKNPYLQVYALSPASIQFLKELDAWSVLEGRSQPYSSMQIWEENGPGCVKFSAADFGADELGRICENDTILASLYDAISRAGSTVDLLYGSSISSLHVQPNEANGYNAASVILTDCSSSSGSCSKTLTTKLLVGADGGNNCFFDRTGESPVFYPKPVAT